MKWLREHWLPVLAIILALVVVNQCTMRGQYRDINRVERERDQAREERAKLEIKVADITLKQNNLQNEIVAAENEVKALQDKVADKEIKIVELEMERKLNVLNVRELDTTDELESAFGETYPEIVRVQGFGIMEREVDGIFRDYLVLPAWSVETFLVEHGNLNAAEGKVTLYSEIVETFGTIDQIRQRVTGLERDKFNLEQQRANAYQSGYNECNVRYEATVERYVNQLEKPRLDFGTLSIGLGVLATGAALGGGMYLGNQMCQ